jgi:hypothetical protein
MPSKPAVEPLGIDDALYARNIGMLFRVDSRLAQRIDECELDGSVRVEPSRKGPPTACVVARDGDRPMYLYSRIDPASEAKRWAESVPVGDSLCYMVSGFGLGHHLKALRERLKGDAFFIVSEPNLQLIKLALGTVDLAGLFEQDRCVILTSPDKNDIQTRLEKHNTNLMLGAQFVSHSASDRVASEFQKQMRQLMKDHMTYCRMSLVTMVANSRITCQNVAQNLPRFLSTPPVDILRDRFAGYPAVLVAAGPSLRKNIDLLADLKGKAIIIAVQTTFKTLLEHGIEPDFVTSLDYHEMSKRFFEDIPASVKTHLVAEPKATWHVFDAYNGPVSMVGNKFARLCVGDQLAGRDYLKAGATVAHLALYAAVYMGCRPIALVGQDLGYTNHVYYSPGVAMHDIWRPELSRFHTIETKEWERLVRARQILIKAKDIHGQDMYSDEQLFTYLQQFEGDFAALEPGRVIDATEGGVRKANTLIMPLAEFIDTHCQQQIPASRFAYLDEQDWQDLSKLDQGEQALRKRLEEVAEMKQVCDDMLAILRQLPDLLETPDQFNRRLSEVDKLRVEVRRHAKTYELISAVSQMAELQRHSADARIGLADLDDRTRARRQLDRDTRFVEAVAEGADQLTQILEGALERFAEARSAATEGD